MPTPLRCVGIAQLAVRPLADNMFITRVVFLGSVGLLFIGCASNRTRGQSDVCEVHHARMSKTSVPILYGKLAPSERENASYYTAITNFPHAKQWIGGGCMIPMFPSHRAVIYSCEACKAARQQWEHDYDTRR